MSGSTVYNRCGLLLFAALCLLLSMCAGGKALSASVPDEVHDLSNVTRAFEAYLKHFAKEYPHNAAVYDLRRSHFEVRRPCTATVGQRRDERRETKKKDLFSSPSFFTFALFLTPLQLRWATASSITFLRILNLNFHACERKRLEAVNNARKFSLFRLLLSLAQRPRCLSAQCYRAEHAAWAHGALWSDRF